MNGWVASVIALDACFTVASLIAVGRAARSVMGSASTGDEPKDDGWLSRPSVQSAGAFGLFVAATALELAAITHVFPSLVPGAMCGLNVVKTMAFGPAALMLRLAAVVGLWVWLVLDRLNPTGDKAMSAVRDKVTLVAVPVAWAAAYHTYRGLDSLPLTGNASCNEVAHYRLAGIATSGIASHVAGRTEAVVTVVGAVLLIGLGVWLMRHPDAAHRSLTAWGMALVVIPWFGLGIWMLLDLAAPYWVGAGHRCVLCLLVPRRGVYGLVAYAAGVAALFETVRVAVATSMRPADEEGKVRAARATKGAARNVAIAALAFVVAALGPVLWWRITHGTWM